MKLTFKFTYDIMCPNLKIKEIYCSTDYNHLNFVNLIYQTIIKILTSL